MSDDVLDSPTFRLFSVPSFWGGFGSILSVFGRDYGIRTSRTPEEADAEAIRSDWEAVGMDMTRALEAVKQEIG